MLQFITKLYQAELDKPNEVSVVLVFLQYTLSHILLRVIVFQNVYVFQDEPSVLVSSVTLVGFQFLTNATVLPAVFAVKHNSGGWYSLHI